MTASYGMQIHGPGRRREILYVCPLCPATQWGLQAPRCPNGHGRMEPEA